MGVAPRELAAESAVSETSGLAGIPQALIISALGQVGRGRRVPAYANNQLANRFRPTAST